MSLSNKYLSTFSCKVCANCKELGLNRCLFCLLQKRQSDLYELGDRLSEKLMVQREEMKEKMGNWSCIMQELKLVDENMELDLENMLDDVKSMNIRDKWLEDNTIEDIRTCYAVSRCFPTSI